MSETIDGSKIQAPVLLIMLSKEQIEQLLQGQTIDYAGRAKIKAGE